MPGKTGRRKHIAQRTCVGCREVLPKRSLIRIVRSESGVHIDETSKAAGRGAYLHNQRSCWERAIKGSLANALKMELSVEEKDALMEYARSLPDTQ